MSDNLRFHDYSIDHCECSSIVHHESVFFTNYLFPCIFVTSYMYVSDQVSARNVAVVSLLYEFLKPLFSTIHVYTIGI